MKTFAIFQMHGTSPDCIDELNMWQMGSESVNAKSRRIQFGILSGPTDFRILMRESLWMYNVLIATIIFRDEIEQWRKIRCNFLK